MMQVERLIFGVLIDLLCFTLSSRKAFLVHTVTFRVRLANEEKQELRVHLHLPRFLFQYLILCFKYLFKFPVIAF